MTPRLKRRTHPAAGYQRKGPALPLPALLLPDVPQPAWRLPTSCLSPEEFDALMAVASGQDAPPAPTC